MAKPIDLEPRSISEKKPFPAALHLRLIIGLLMAGLPLSLANQGEATVPSTNRGEVAKTVPAPQPERGVPELTLAPENAEVYAARNDY